MLPMLDVVATPFGYAFPAGATALVVIDMQRDFVEPGGFGSSLGNDVTHLHSAIAPIAELLPLSNIERHVRPLSSVRQTPPPAAPK